MLKPPNEPSVSGVSDPAPEQAEGALSRRRFAGAAALAGAGFLSAPAAAQTRQEQIAGREAKSRSDPGPENKTLLAENPNANNPPFTDHGNPGPIWFSFDLAPKRMQGGGWTHQVTQRELPPSRDLAGVNMRLTAGSFRELHWHTADEWAIMLTGNARVSVMQPDGKMFIEDVGVGDLWYFPAGFPHSIQGLGGDGCEFLLVTEKKYTFKMTSMEPTQKTAGGETRVVDSTNFPVAANIASAMVTIRPGGLREMHWHPNVSEWQYWIRGKGRMTVVTTEARARTMDFHSNDVGYVPSMAGHCIENTGTEDLVFLEMFKSAHYSAISLNQWIARMPDKMAEAHLKLSAKTIRSAPQGKNDVLPK